MSIDKFKRMLKVLYTEHINLNDYYFLVHFIQLKLASKKEFATNYKSKLQRVLSTGFDELYGRDFCGSESEKDSEITFIID